MVFAICQVVSLLLSPIIMLRDYKAESIRKFPLQAAPFKDDYAEEGDYKRAYSEYKRERNAIVARRQEWIDEEREADRRAEEVAEAKRKAEEAAEAKRRESARGKSAASSSRSKGEGSGKGKQRAEVVIAAVSGALETLPDSEQCERCVVQGMSSTSLSQCPFPIDNLFF